MESSGDFAQLTNEYLADLYAAEPVMATARGVHDYDGRLPDPGRFAAADDLRRCRAYLHAIDRLSLSSMTPDERIDCRLARADTQMRILDHEQVRRRERQPSVHVDTVAFAVYLLLSRDFAPVARRAESALSRLRAVPEYLHQARENLSNPPRVHVEAAMEAATGAETYLRETVPAFAEPQGACGTAMAEAARYAADAVADYRRYLSEVVLPNAGDDFALGEELFDYTLRVGMFLKETGAELVEMARKTLESTRREMASTANSIDPGSSWEQVVHDLKRRHPAAGGLVAAWRDEMERARQFVIERGLVTMPPNESLSVTETPPFQRATLPYAAYVPPAPFEENQQGIFWVTPVDESASVDARERQLQGHSLYNLPIIALHEAYPGHHLQFTTANRHPSRFRRHFADSNLFIEGWALYCEEMMHEQGFYADPRVRLMQLRNQLWRACRVIIDVEMHARRISFNDAVRLLVEEAKLEEVHARAEVRRYAANPTQPLTYLTGKRQILALRERAEKRKGSRFDLRAFHDQLLAYGAVPPRILHESMFAVD